MDDVEGGLDRIAIEGEAGGAKWEGAGDKM